MVDLSGATAGKGEFIPVGQYGRTSSRMQRKSSIEDQLRECTDACKEKGWTILEDWTRADEAKTGQLSSEREAWAALELRASQKDCPFKGIIIDDTSRFGRNLSHTLPLSDRLKHYGVFLYFVAQELDSRDANFRDLLIKFGSEDERYSSNLAKKTHRGHRGRVHKGFNPTGRLYGYDNVPVFHPTKRGEYGFPFVEAVKLVINEEQAEVVRRIFKMYLDGLGCNQIAGVLNAEKVQSTLHGSGTKKRAWRTNTIKKMLKNEKYAGIHVWNRTKVVINPIRDIKEQRPRPESEWERVAVPEWQILTDEIWAATVAETARRASVYQSRRLGGMNRTEQSRKYVFSGLLQCALCGRSMFVGAGVKAGVRYVCSGHRQYKNCENRRTILKTRLEEQLIGALVANLSQPSLRSEIHEVFRSQLATRWDEARRNSQNEKRKGELEARLQHLEVGNSNLLDAIEIAGPESELLKRLQSIKEERVIVQQQLAACATLVCDPPTEEEMSAFIDEKMNTLAAVLMSDEEKVRQEIHKRISVLIMRPVETDKGFAFEVSGDVSLFSSSDAMQDTSRERSVLHCIDYTLRFAATLTPGMDTRAQREGRSIRAKQMHANRSPEDKRKWSLQRKKWHAERREKRAAASAEVPVEQLD